MRIPLTNICRAYPEFDHLDDEACRRLVRRARVSYTPKQRFVNTATFVPVALFLVVVSLQAGVFVVSAADDVLRETGRSAPSLVIAFVALVAMGVLPCLLLLSVSHALFRERLRQELHRTTCARCRYGFIGLPIENDAVRCPECGEVMPLGDLSPGAAALIRAGAE